MVLGGGLRRGAKIAFGFFFTLLIIVGMTGDTWVHAAETNSKNQQKTIYRSYRLSVGKSLIIHVPEPVKQISMADPKVADYTLISPEQVYILGASPGVTNMTLWAGDDRIIAVYDIEVGIDVSVLKRKLHEILPEEQDIRVASASDSIILAGSISSTANLSQALALAEAFAGAEKVRNLLQVRGVHQVMLEVRVAEMSRSVAKELGFNYAVFSDQSFGLLTIGGLTNFGGEGTIDVGPAINALYRITSGSFTWYQFIDALQNDGLIKILAEPTLVTTSGQPANFLAGGEFPIPVPQGLGTVAIEYKTFGVALTFTPTVLSEDKISIKVEPEVSELDFTTGTQIASASVPGLNTRRASTVVELADGQSFAIAGILRESVRETISRFPFLGDIPILGALFRSSSFQKSETELVILVTPHLVKPLDMARQPLPTDQYIEPTDTEFFLKGMMIGTRKQAGPDFYAPTYPRNSGRMDGQFGHKMP